MKFFGYKVTKWVQSKQYCKSWFFKKVTLKGYRESYTKRYKGDKGNEFFKE